MDQVKSEKIISPGIQAAKEVFDLINQKTNEFIENKQPDSATVMQSEIYRALRVKFGGI